MIRQGVLTQNVGPRVFIIKSLVGTIFFRSLNVISKAIFFEAESLFIDFFLAK